MTLVRRLLMSSGGHGSFAPPAVVVIGDSITVATGLTAYSVTMADQLGWTLTTTDAIGSTGYLCDVGGAVFADRIAADLASGADRVVVQGVVNDVSVGYTAAQIGVAAADLFAAIRAIVPAAAIYAIGTFWHVAPTTDYLAADTAIRSAIAPYGRFFGPMQDGWINSGNEAVYVNSADHIHPTQAGHDFLAAQLVAAITT